VGLRKFRKLLILEADGILANDNSKILVGYKDRRFRTRGWHYRPGRRHREWARQQQRAFYGNAPVISLRGVVNRRRGRLAYRTTNSLTESYVFEDKIHLINKGKRV
jgi:hypothetical protein